MDMARFKQTLLAISTWASNGEFRGTGAYVRGAIVAAVVLVVLAAAVRASRGKAGTDLRPALPFLYILSYTVVLLLTA
jgi:hypothetical protein